MKQSHSKNIQRAMEYVGKYLYSLSKHEFQRVVPEDRRNDIDI